jgi:hypothetical protein
MVYKQFGIAGFLVGAVFLFLLGLGMAYEWRKGDLEWERPKIIISHTNKDLQEENVTVNTEA